MAATQQPEASVLDRRAEITALYRTSLERGDIEGAIFALDAAYYVSISDPDISDALRAVDRELAEREGIEPVEGATEVVRDALARLRDGGADVDGDDDGQGKDVGECLRHGTALLVGEECAACSYELREPGAAAMYDRWIGRPRREDAADYHLEGAYEERTEFE